jgi:hypothetical protein
MVLARLAVAARWVQAVAEPSSALERTVAARQNGPWMRERQLSAQAALLRAALLRAEAE